MMDVHSLLRKLEPLMPKEVERWRRALPLVNEQTRKLIEQHVIVTARKRLGDVDRCLLLPPPPPSTAKGALSLGTVLYGGEGWPFGISEGELLQNMAILGRSGSGKTNVVFQLILELDRRGVPFLFLDFKRTCRHLLGRLSRGTALYTPGRSIAPFAFNPFIPPPDQELRLHVSQVVDLLASAYTLGDGAKSVLERAITSAFEAQGGVATAQDALRSLELEASGGRSAGWRETAVRALRSLEFAGLQGGTREEQMGFAASLFQQNSVIELDALSDNTRAFLIPCLLHWLYMARLGASDRERLRLVVVVEEAHHVFRRAVGRSDDSVMTRLLRQCREIGIALVIVDQQPSLLSPVCLGNVFTAICLNQKNPSDVNAAARLCLLNEHDARFLSLLPVGDGVVKLQDRWPHPFLVRFTRVSVPKGAMTDHALLARPPASGARSGSNEPLGLIGDHVPRIPLSDTPLNDLCLRFLEDIATHADDGVRDRYVRLCLSMRRGTRLKAHLLALGWIDEALFPVGSTRRTIIRLTSKAREYLGLPNAGTGRESLAHEYWKRFYARRMKGLGYVVQLEARRHGGRVDVCATKGAEHAAVEVESGKSDVVKNVRNCLGSRFDRIIVVATDETALSQVERQLALAGLLVPGRVDILLCDKLPKSRVRTSHRFPTDELV